MDEKTRQILMSSKSENWLTPKDLFQKLHRVFHFKCDPCTMKSNPLGMKVFYTRKMDGLTLPWVGPAFVNPPYSMPVMINGRYVRRADGTIKRTRVIHHWVQKGYHESLRGITNVMLITQRLDTEIWQDVIIIKAKAICLMRGRKHFSKEKDPSTFGSALVVFTTESITEEQKEMLIKEGRTTIYHQPSSLVTDMPRVASVY